MFRSKCSVAFQCMTIVMSVLLLGGIAVATPDSYTKLLIHSDTTVETDSIVDSSPSAHTITVNGTTHHETDQAKFGSSSIQFTPAGYAYLKLDTVDDFNLGTGDWTIDFWIRMADTSGEQWVFANYQGDGANGIALRFSGNRWYMNVGSSWTGQEFVSTVNTNIWYHIAIVGESGSTIKFYQDGTQVGSTWNVNYNISSTKTLEIGRQTDVTYGHISAFLDEFRVSKGIARWTANFTPLSVPYNSLSAPANFSVAPNNESVDLSWDAVTGADSYTVYYGETSGSLTQSQSVTSGTTLTLSNLTNYSKYYFKVVAVDASGEGDFTNELSTVPFASTWIKNGTVISYNEGNVGIGTNSPQSKLAVNGKITCKEVQVTLNSWADRVFSPSYTLLPLDRVKAHIEEKGHLPGIPSEAELKATGLPMKEMMTAHMAKIEELTLYVIALQEENQKLAKRLETLEKKQK